MAVYVEWYDRAKREAARDRAACEAARAEAEAAIIAALARQPASRPPMDREDDYAPLAAAVEETVAPPPGTAAWEPEPYADMLARIAAINPDAWAEAGRDVMRNPVFAVVRATGVDEVVGGGA